MFARLFVIAWIVISWTGFSVAFAAPPKKLNVLFILSDDMRPDLGCYGHKTVQSPNIDALAKSGVRFDRAYCQYPLCNPSRSSMLTGRHPTTTGVLDNRRWFGAAHPDWVTLPRHFKNHGYVSLRAGKVFHGGIDDAEAWTEGGETHKFSGDTAPPSNPNIDRTKTSDRIVVLDGDGETHNDFKTAERTIELLRQHKDRPFFMACGFTKPHSPPSAPQKYFDKYDATKILLPVDFAPEPTLRDEMPARALTPNGDLFIRRKASEEEARQVIQAYWASISWTDWNVGRVVSELDRLGLRDNTVIVFWGDHGYHLGEKGKWSKHSSLFEVGTRVPLIMVVPGAKGNGGVAPEPVQSLDIYPTLCELCGLEKPDGLEGHSLLPLLDNPAAFWPHAAYTVYGNGSQLGVAVRTHGYRYVEYDFGKAGTMLFDERADPDELNDLSDDPKHAEGREALKKLATIHARPK